MNKIFVILLVLLPGMASARHQSVAAIAQRLHVMVTSDARCWNVVGYEMPMQEIPKLGSRGLRNLAGRFYRRDGHLPLYSKRFYGVQHIALCCPPAVARNYIAYAFRHPRSADIAPLALMITRNQDGISDVLRSKLKLDSKFSRAIKDCMQVWDPADKS